MQFYVKEKKMFTFIIHIKEKRNNHKKHSIKGGWGEVIKYLQRQMWKNGKLLLPSKAFIICFYEIQVIKNLIKRNEKIILKKMKEFLM